MDQYINYPMTDNSILLVLAKDLELIQNTVYEMKARLPQSPSNPRSLEKHVKELFVEAYMQSIPCEIESDFGNLYIQLVNYSVCLYGSNISRLKISQKLALAKLAAYYKQLYVISAAISLDAGRLTPANEYRESLYYAMGRSTENYKQNEQLFELYVMMAIQSLSELH